MSLYFFPWPRLPHAFRASVSRVASSRTCIQSPSSAVTMSRSASTKAPPQPPRPSSSVVLLSPENQVLLLHRVKSSTSFASAHVFPGGNLDPFHDGSIPAVDAPDRHQDGPSYRIGAIRETFEETGILLAKRKDGSGELVSLEAAERDEARKKIHGNQVKFTDWVESVGGVLDTGKFEYPAISQFCCLMLRRRPTTMHQVDNTDQCTQTLHHPDVHILPTTRQKKRHIAFRNARPYP